MSLRNAILGEVGLDPGSSSQVHRRLQARMGDYWPVNDGQVYQVLTSAVAAGLATADPDETGKPVYALTDEGREQVARWFDEDFAKATPQRSELYLKLDLLGEGVPEGLVHAVQDQLHHTARAARKVRKVLKQDNLEEFRALSLRGVLAHLEVDVEWLTEVLDALER
ncbi:MAG: helix-turn-helix transcriptional regulator [Acidimicrobiia bacterium]|nr:helix-turn-helix transcriptional regulator [Acidimicrobiia bacterium]